VGEGSNLQLFHPSANLKKFVSEGWRLLNPSKKFVSEGWKLLNPSKTIELKV